MAMSDAGDGLADVRVSFDARKAAFCVLLFLLMFAPGIRIGGTPIPSSLFACILYVLVFNPKIPKGIGPVFVCVFTYILLASARNTLQLTGGVRDFLYIGLCIESFVLTIALFDIVERLSIRDTTRIILGFLAAEILLQFLEYLNPAGFNGLIRPLLAYWDDVNNSGFLAPIWNRVPGSFGSPTVAGFSCYLIARSAAVLSGRRWMTYLALIPLTIGGARMATAIFLLWEVILPIFVSQHRAIAISIFGAFVVAAYVVFMTAPDLLAEIYFVKTLMDYNSIDRLISSNSAFTRIVGIQWALNQPLSTWLLGGMTAAEISAFSINFFTFDSELTLRSMQYGLVGYGCLIAMNTWSGYSIRKLDWWFGIFLVLAGALANFVATNLAIFPFLILYNLCLLRARSEPTTDSTDAKDAVLSPA
ncbi:MAG: hypothetical protein WDN08_21605 [Rhizomicrobium sp.]